MNRILRIAPVVTVITGLAYLLTASAETPPGAPSVKSPANPPWRLTLVGATEELAPLPPVAMSGADSSVARAEAPGLHRLPPIGEQVNEFASELTPLPVVADEDTSANNGVRQEAFEVIQDEVLGLQPLPAADEPEAATKVPIESVASLPPLPIVLADNKPTDDIERLPETALEVEEPTLAVEGSTFEIEQPVELDQSAEQPIRLPAADDARPVRLPELAIESPQQETAREEAVDREPARLAMSDPTMDLSESGNQSIVHLPLVIEPEVAAARRRVQRDLAARERLAAEYVQKGFHLGNRGAHFSARSEFIEAMKLLAATSDQLDGSQGHSKSLAAGLRALEESDDFVPARSVVESELDLSILVSSHRTPVLKDVDCNQLSMFDARQRYYAYAQEKLAEAVGKGRAGSMALYGLGRLESKLGEDNTLSNPAASHKAMVYHQAALQSEAENYMAANELGVLLARFGQYEDAKMALNHSIRLKPEPATWRNLAVVNQRLGDQLLARQALGQAEAIARAERQKSVKDPANSDVRWKSPEEFARQSTRGMIR